MEIGIWVEEQTTSSIFIDRVANKLSPHWLLRIYVEESVLEPDRSMKVMKLFFLFIYKLIALTLIK